MKRIAALAPQNLHQIRLLTYGKPESEVGELLAGRKDPKTALYELMLRPQRAEAG